MNYNFKVGDFVKQPSWDKFYQVVDTAEGKIKLYETTYGKSHWYTLDLAVEGWLKKEEEPVKQKIDMQKNYRTMGGRPVRILCVDNEGNRPVIALIKGTEILLWLDEYGDTAGVKCIEEVLAVDWSKVVVDTPIWVQFDYIPQPRHFEKFENGYVHFYRDGYTSHTVPGANSLSNKVVASLAYLEKPKCK